MFAQPTLEEAFAKFKPETLASKIADAEEERRQMLDLFPREAWPEMPLERYALGHEHSRDSYCWWIEYNTPHLGSMKGGASGKHIIFKPKDGADWSYDHERYSSVEEAWEAVRKGFVEAFANADAGDWGAVDEIEALSPGPALRTKTLHVYFRNDILPIYTLPHVQHFLRLLGRPEAEESGYRTVTLNRVLLKALRALPTLSGMDTVTLGLFLYHWADPRETRRVVKIAPGPDAVYWEECLRGGYICVGWDEVGDLREFGDKATFREAFAKVYPYDGSARQVSRKANELWTLAELEPGDLVVANHGISEVLAVGEVEERTYFWNPERKEFRNCVAVRWDTTYEKTIAPVGQWALVTVAPIPYALQNTILGIAQTADDGEAPKPLADPLFPVIEEALERKGQAVLYGPPGTGKTYVAGRFAEWWMQKKNGTSATAPYFTLLTFHASYSYEDFIEGYRPVAVGNTTAGLVLRIENGVFKEVCRVAEEDGNKDRFFLVLVDEINRANIAKVFGELLTVLEKDKRGMAVRLPQSKGELRVPPNVFLLGTMNTADRSIALLDLALRRRFAFLELMPESDLLRGTKLGPLDLGDFLDVLNRRVARKHGREKQIGHSYLLGADGRPVDDPAEFARRFRYEIVPLLQEYCYDDYEELREYLGAELVAGDPPALDQERLGDPTLLVQALATAIGREAEEEV